jgi:hypothetical protein
VRAVLATVMFAVALCVGCGGVVGNPATTSQSLMITITDDGNPKVPVCTTTLVNCKTNLIVIDLTTGRRIPLPLTTTSYDAPVVTDAYEVHVVGYDLNGKSIESVCCTVAVK